MAQWLGAAAVLAKVMSLARTSVGSQLLITQALGDLIPSPGLYRHLHTRAGTH